MARGPALRAGPQARQSRQRWTWPLPPLRLRDPSPQPGVSYRTGAALSAAGWLRVRPPRTLAQVAAGSALPAVWVPAGSLHPGTQGRGCLGSTRSSRRRPSPDARGEGGDTGRGGGNGGGGGEKLGARRDPRGGGGAESHGRGAGTFLPAQATLVQLTAAAGSGELAQDLCAQGGAQPWAGGARGSLPGPAHLLQGLSFPPGTGGACLILV